MLRRVRDEGFLPGAIVKSIVNKVRYTIEDATGLAVAKVNVFVDGMKTE